MNVIIDTPIWSDAFRKTSNKTLDTVKELKTLISNQQAIIIGPIRQELLSGYSDLTKFELLRNKLQYFENTTIQNSDFIKAAEFANICRSKGIQGSHTDFLICSVANRIDAPIFTLDNDFQHYQKHLPIKIYQPQY